ncbi:MAG: LacI family transcriptional regulator [Sulfobacillus thermosulfidooxidans]|uniref:LacI family transcriptional regulator n=1 Tax=Sulfobacillus thermotolerans TaxID=338644 RepID=A0ABN5GYN7_9FIRM|nr:LacI family DNA-binding transcriptional regulator [Sulfobacillus sp. hq2]AUW93436.1 LacI family transcriptional regulator [Sulfobacillus thermotolerans]MCY0908827.1 LacI family DNA-binding transcriptional regulator [Sulfobacillus thermotolerans]POB10670.1 LacI family transcriptional regulator [Sulfobacillus sp. hq2]PSR37644.1 MAG: LacI family transcriptional regulator [Sulfobacillus thermosulfidooxidans]
MATIRDVARAANVSVSTVSLFLSQPHRVSEATRERVSIAVEKLHYRPNGSARDLRTRKTNTIGVFLHNLSGPFYSELIAGVEEVTDTLGLTTIVSGLSKNHLQGSLRLLREGRVDGAIVLDPAIESKDLRKYASASLPVVVLDRSLSANLQSDFVTAVAADHQEGGYLAGRHLLEMGYSRFTFIAGPIDSEDSRLRHRGFFRALQEAGVDTMTVPVVHGDFKEQGGAQAMAALLNNGLIPDAVFAANDEMALGVMQTLAQKNLRVPQDIAVMGFDDIRLARYVTPGLSTIHQPMYELGRAAMMQLDRALNGETRIPPIILPTTLVVRGSTVPQEKKAGENYYAAP